MRFGLLALTAFALAGCSMGQDMAVSDQAVKQFHRQLDAGQFAAIEAAGTPEMRMPPGRTTQFLSILHARFGKVVSSDRVGFNDQVNTGGHMMTMTYKTVFEKGAATETFIYRLSDGKAVLLGYNVNSDMPRTPAAPAASENASDQVTVKQTI